MGKRREGRTAAVTLRSPRGQAGDLGSLEWRAGGGVESREWGVPRIGWYLRVHSQFTHVVLLQPAAGVVGVSVRWPIQVGSDVLASPRPQQLLTPWMVPHEAGKVVEAGPAADPAGTGRQAPLDLGGREGGGGGRSGGHGGRAELGPRSPAVCSAAAQRASNISGAGAAATGRPPPHLLICMPGSHWPLGGTRLVLGAASPLARTDPSPERWAPSAGARWPRAGRGRARQVCPAAGGWQRIEMDSPNDVLRDLITSTSASREKLTVLNSAVSRGDRQKATGQKSSLVPGTKNLKSSQIQAQYIIM